MNGRPDDKGAGLGWIDLTLAADALYKEADRLWFEFHPLRSFRLRAAIVGEPVASESTWVLVKQVNPGMREKRYFDVPEGTDLLRILPDNDFVCIALWQALEKGGNSINLGRIVAAAKTMEMLASDSVQ